MLEALVWQIVDIRIGIIDALINDCGVCLDVSTNMIYSLNKSAIFSVDLSNTTIHSITYQSNRIID